MLAETLESIEDLENQGKYKETFWKSKKNIVGMLAEMLESIEHL